jgi:hypothetical protein
VVKSVVTNFFVMMMMMMITKTKFLRFELFCFFFLLWLACPINANKQSIDGSLSVVLSSNLPPAAYTSSSNWDRDHPKNAFDVTCANNLCGMLLKI